MGYDGYQGLSLPELASIRREPGQWLVRVVERMGIIMTQNAFTGVFRHCYTPFSGKVGAVFFEPVADVVSHLGILPNRHGTVMKKLSTMHSPAFTAPKN